MCSFLQHYKRIVVAWSLRVLVDASTENRIDTIQTNGNFILINALLRIPICSHLLSTAHSIHCAGLHTERVLAPFVRFR